MKEGSSSSLRRYLLGQLHEEEQSRIEERLFADQTFMEEISAAEDELVEDYVGGELSTTDRKRFEAFYLVTPERRRNLRLTRALHEAFANSQDLAGIGTSIGFSRSMPWMLAAASLVIAFGISAYAVLRVGQERATFSSRERDLREQLAKRENQIAQMETRKPAVGHSEANVPLLSLLLTPDLVVRGGSNTPQGRLVVPRTTAQLQLHLKLNLAADQEFESYLATLEKQNGQTIWNGDKLHPAGAGGNRWVVLNLPPRDLVSDKYRVTLSGKTAAGAVEVIDEYSFEVVAQ